MDDRYDKWHTEGKATFYLANISIATDEARFLILKVLEQSIADYCSLFQSTNQREQEDWETARAFLFDDNYTIDWGEWIINPTELLLIVDLEIDWVRYQTRKKFKDKHGFEYIPEKNGPTE